MFGLTRALNANKYNILSFQNTPNPLLKFSTLNRMACWQHPDKQAKYRNQQNNVNYCYSCAIQEASRGVQIEALSIRESDKPVYEEDHHIGSRIQYDKKDLKVHKDRQSRLDLQDRKYLYRQGTTKSLHNNKYCRLVIQAPISFEPSKMLTDQFHRMQQYIRETIYAYNKIFQQIMEILSHLQIQDIMKFNQQLESNYAKFVMMMEQQDTTGLKWSNRSDNTASLAKLYRVLYGINRNISDFDRKLSFKSTETSRCDGSHRSISPAQSRSRLDQVVGIKQKTSNDECRLSLNDTKVTTKTRSTHEYRHGRKYVRNGTKLLTDEALYDTPESIKSKLGCNAIKVTNYMAVAMFDKIDVCESIDLSNADDSKAANSRVKKSRSKYRYDGNGNIDTER